MIGARELFRSYNTQWNGTVTATAPWLTAPQQFQSQPTAAEKAMRLYCFQKISPTSRLKSATRTGPADQREQRRDRKLIKANESAEDFEHQGAKIEARLA